MDQPVFRHPSLAVRSCAYGWGVFALVNIPAGVVVERCPFLVIPSAATEDAPLRDYVFHASDDRSAVDADLRYLALGWGSLFNHDDDPNLSYAVFPKRRLLEFITVREVTAGQQLFISYGTNWWATRGVKRAKKG